MLEFIKDSGICGFLLIIILIVNTINFIVSFIRLRRAQPEEGPRILYGINGIIFWGGVCALLGFLGQYLGIYSALNVVTQAPKINPNLLAQGFTISFSTTIMGMVALLLSALAWFVLYTWYRRKSHAWGREGKV